MKKSLWDIELTRTEHPLEKLAERTAHVTGISLDALLARDRTAIIAMRRHLFFYVARRTGHSCMAVARFMKMDHGAILHGEARIGNDRDTSPQARKVIDGYVERILA